MGVISGGFCSSFCYYWLNWTVSFWRGGKYQQVFLSLFFLQTCSILIFVSRIIWYNICVVFVRFLLNAYDLISVHCIRIKTSWRAENGVVHMRIFAKKRTNIKFCVARLRLPHFKRLSFLKLKIKIIEAFILISVVL